VTEPDVRLDTALRFLSAQPADVDTAAKRLGRGSGVYAWWAAPDVFPDLPGRAHDSDATVRLLYIGRATSLRGRILRNHLRRSGSSMLRRTLAGLLMPTQGYRTMWTDQVVLCPDDEVRLTAWMHANLRITWAEDPKPEDIEPEIVRRWRPPLNIHGVDPRYVQATVVAARNTYDTSVQAPAVNPGP
jgi:hypothetical protein